MGEYYSSHSSDAFTKAKLKQMGGTKVDTGDPYGTGDEGRDDKADDYGKPPKASDSSEFKRGGAVKPHMGRPGRATGGRVGRAKGGGVAEGEINTNEKVGDDPIRLADLPKYAGRARGGKVGKGKTTVNVIIGGQKDQPPPPPPPMMAPPMPPPQAPPQHPPGAPMPGGAGAGGPPINNIMPPPAAGAQTPMRASGGRVNNLGKFAHPAKAGFSDSKAPHLGGGKEGFSDTKPTSRRAPMAEGSKRFKVKLDPNERAGNNGQGRIEKAGRQA